MVRAKFVNRNLEREITLILDDGRRVVVPPNGFVIGPRDLLSKFSNNLVDLNEVSQDPVPQPALVEQAQRPAAPAIGRRPQAPEGLPAPVAADILVVQQEAVDLEGMDSIEKGLVEKGIYDPKIKYFDWEKINFRQISKEELKFILNSNELSYPEDATRGSLTKLVRQIFE